jgi:uncharacterized protein (DUF1697 family)
MTSYVALLRAVNVGGTGKLPMADLKKMCAEAGFNRTETYIASGNLVFESKGAPAKVKSELEARLRVYFGKPAAVLVRTAAEMQAVLDANPFPQAESKLTYAIFLDAKPPSAALDNVSGRVDEEIRLGRREIYVHYPSGMGKSKLRIPAASQGTARNMNTVAKLVEMSCPAPAGHGPVPRSS